MAAIRAVNTKPEVALRQSLRSVGATGYRLHLRNLPGKPDIAFTRWKVAVFVDGAFWHGHPDHFRPETAKPYWRDKITRTQERDKLANASLAAIGWTVIRCWDFEVKADVATITTEVIKALRTAGWPTPATPLVN